MLIQTDIEITKVIEDAAWQGNLEQLKSLTAQGVSFNHVMSDGGSLLNSIVINLTCDCIRPELVPDDDWDALSHQQWIDLSNQSKPFRYDVIKLLLELGADPNLGSAEECVLVFPMLHMDTHMLEILLNAGADPNRLHHDDDPHVTLLDWAGRDYCFETIQQPCDPVTPQDQATFDQWLEYLDRMAIKYNYIRPHAIRILRQYGAKTYEEMHPEQPA